MGNIFPFDSMERAIEVYIDAGKSGAQDLSSCVFYYIWHNLSDGFKNVMRGELQKLFPNIHGLL